MTGTAAQPPLPLLSDTPRRWAEIAAASLPIFLADHAVCEQQATLTALNLVARYPLDDELVRKMTSLAIEEATHLRRVTRLLHERGLKLARRRPNSYVQGLMSRVRRDRAPELKIDRLFVAALIEARSCERFTRILEVVGGTDSELTDLLDDLGPAERRHWEMFHALAVREGRPETVEARWREWLAWESELMAGRGSEPTVHG
jgi:tRNA-(ms[2]io[6]A)-hydroxylase